MRLEISLNNKQKNELGATLEKRRGELIAELARDADRARAEAFAALAGEAPDAAEASVAALIADTDQAELSRDLLELQEVEAARARLKKGTYGQCSDCGVGIPIGRLRAQPAALRCVPCQERHDRQRPSRVGAKL
jgi:RNA polymerase-binding transcription factor DksA